MKRFPTDHPRIWDSVGSHIPVPGAFYSAEVRTPKGAAHQCAGHEARSLRAALDERLPRAHRVYAARMWWYLLGGFHRDIPGGEVVIGRPPEELYI